MPARELGKNLLLLVVALAASAVLAEAALRFLLPQNLSGSWRIQTETGLLVNKSQGSSRHQFGERVVRYRFAVPHLRELKRTSLPGASRILVLGDSFTFGWLLDDGDTYVARLQELIDAEFGAGTFVLLDAAAGGWGTADYLFFLEDFGSQIRPDAVLVFLNIDDIGRSLASPLLKVGYGGAGTTAERVRVPPSRLKQALNSGPISSVYQWVLEHSHLLQLIRKALLPRLGTANFGLADRGAAVPERGAAAPAGTVAGANPAPAAVGAILFRRLRDWCDAHHAALWVTTTGFNDPKVAATASEPTQAFMASAARTFTELGVPYADLGVLLHATLTAQHDAYTIPGEGHPNERAAQLIASTVYSRFLRERLLESSARR